VGQVVLDAMDLASEGAAVGGAEVCDLAHHVLHVQPRARVAESLDDKARRRPLGERESHLLTEAASRISVDGDMIHVAETDTRLVEAEANRLGGYSRPVFQPSEAFLLRRSDQLPIDEDAGRRIGVVRVDSKHNLSHRTPFRPRRTRAGLRPPLNCT
jgi:hypothetical protein